MPSSPPQFNVLIPALVGADVDFILIGGVAGVLHGAARVTYDVDVVYSRTKANQNRLIKALAPFSPYLRGVPSGLPFSWNKNTLTYGVNFTLTTSSGDLDLLGEVAGGGTYDSLLPHSISVTAFGCSFLCVTLPRLIELKRAAGRPKDIEAIAELEALLEEDTPS